MSFMLYKPEAATNAGSSNTAPQDSSEAPPPGLGDEHRHGPKQRGKGGKNRTDGPPGYHGTAHANKASETSTSMLQFRPYAMKMVNYLFIYQESGMVFQEDWWNQCNNESSD